MAKSDGGAVHDRRSHGRGEPGELVLPSALAAVGHAGPHAARPVDRSRDRRSRIGGLDTMAQILIAGYYGAGNFGDEICLAGLVSEIRATRSETGITVLSHDPAQTQKMHSVESVSYVSPREILASLWNADAVLLGGGGLLQDKTSARS